MQRLYRLLLLLVLIAGPSAAAPPVEHPRGTPGITGFSPAAKLLGVDDWDEIGEASEGLYIFISWRSGLELVCPTRAVGTFERHLAGHGEGFYCLVFGVASLDQAIANIARLNGRAPRELPDPPAAVMERFSVAREAFVGEVSGLRLMLGEFVPREAEK